MRGAFERVDELLVLAGAERGDDERLRLAAGEQRRAVRARQHVHLGDDRAHGLEVAAVDAAAGLDDVAAHDLLLELLEHASRAAPSRWRRRLRAASAFLTLALGRLDQLVALLLLRRGEGLAQVGLDERLDLVRCTWTCRAAGNPTAPWRPSRPA